MKTRSFKIIRLPNPTSFTNRQTVFLELLKSAFVLDLEIHWYKYSKNTLRNQNIIRQTPQCTKQTSFSLRYRISIKHVPILIQLHVQLNPETCSTWPSLIYVRSTSLGQIMVMDL